MPPAACRGCRIGHIDVLEHAPLELETRAIVVGARQRAGGKVAIELAQLVPVDGDVRLTARNAPARAAHEQRPQHQHDRERGKRRSGEPEGDHSSSLAARLRSASLNCGAPTRRRRSTRASR